MTSSSVQASGSLKSGKNGFPWSLNSSLGRVRSGMRTNAAPAKSSATATKIRVLISSFMVVYRPLDRQAGRSGSGPMEDDEWPMTNDERSYVVKVGRTGGPDADLGASSEHRAATGHNTARTPEGEPGELQPARDTARGSTPAPKSRNQPRNSDCHLTSVIRHLASASSVIQGLRPPRPDRW